MPDVQVPDDPTPDPSALRIEDLLASDDTEAARGAPPAREGLPRSFRMRADKHYVEMLDAPAPRTGAEAPLVSRRAQPTADPAVDEAARAARDAATEMAQALAALRASTNLLSDRGAGLAATVAPHLIRAELWRATCLLQGSRFLRGELTLSPRPVRAREILDAALTAIGPERRLRAVALDERLEVGDQRILADEELLVCAVSGLLTATIGLLDGRPDAAIAVSAETVGQEVVIRVTQDHAAAPTDWASRSVAIVAASRIVTASEGRFAVSATGIGTELRVSMPRLR